MGILFRVRERANSPRILAPGIAFLLVDRVTGRVTQMNLPKFDPFYSTASWYRDYVAYCGVSDDGKKMFAIVTQLGRRKPILKKPLGEPDGDEMPDSECPAPAWQRQPARVTFQPVPNAATRIADRLTWPDSFLGSGNFRGFRVQRSMCEW